MFSFQVIFLSLRLYLEESNETSQNVYSKQMLKTCIGSFEEKKCV